MSGHSISRAAFGGYLPPAVASVIVLCAIGALGLWARDAWLVPSLGSALFVQVMTPQEPSGRLWNTAAGQLAGVAAGFTAVFLAGAADVPPFMSHNPLEWSRLTAVGLGAALTVLLQRALDATCPAGGATVLLIALGTVPPSWHGALLLVVGVGLVSLLGEAARVALLRTG